MKRALIAPLVATFLAARPSRHLRRRADSAEEGEGHGAGSADKKDDKKDEKKWDVNNPPGPRPTVAIDVTRGPG